MSIADDLAAPIPLPIAPDNIEPVLQAMHNGEPLIIVSAPPGAGKTETVAHVAALAWHYRESAIVVVQSYEQAQDLVERIEQRFPKCDPVLYCSRRQAPKIRQHLRNRVVTGAADVRQAAARARTVVTVVKKLSQTDLSSKGEQEPVFHWMIVDEAWQMHDARFAVVAPLAERFLLVGDAGQIAPIVRSDVTRWRHSPAGPHHAAPEALLNREWIEPHIINLPISYRLPQDTVSVIQPVFYPDLPFRGASDYPARALVVLDGFDVRTGADRALVAASRGATLVGCELPRKPVRAAVDREAIEGAVALVERILTAGCKMVAFGEERPIRESDIGVVVSRNAQVHAIASAFGGRRPEVFITTANRFQGLQRPVIIAIHPLSGKTDLSEFDSDVGRLCVMASRHQIVCFMLHRDGIADLIAKEFPYGPRSFATSRDVAYLGWRANRDFMRALRQTRRRIRFTAG